MPASRQAMRDFTAARGPDTDDELWLVEHDPVFTQGLAGRPEHVLGAGDIPVVQTQRGGQVTYHGPGQVVAYPLVDLQRLGIYVKEYVYRLEEACCTPWPTVGVTGHRVRSAPGIYVRLADPFDHAVLKPAAPGRPVPRPGQDRRAGHQGHAALRLPRPGAQRGDGPGALRRINPCGYAGLPTVDLRSLGVQVAWDDAAERLSHELQRLLALTACGYTVPGAPAMSPTTRARTRIAPPGR
jgi:lipoyl(octanoyl) transferase